MQIEEHDISEVGRLLLEVIDEQPGIHFRALERAANLNSAGQLRHHVDRLLRNRLILEHEEGGYKRFFRSGHHDPQLLPRIARFARPVPRRIAKLLLVRPLSRTELRRRLGCADSTLGYHLTRMTLLGDVLKHRRCNSCHYSLADPEGVRAALAALEGNGQGDPSGGASPPSVQPNGYSVPTSSAAYATRRPEPVVSSPADPVPRMGRGPVRRPISGTHAAGERVPAASSVRSRFHQPREAPPQAWSNGADPEPPGAPDQHEGIHRDERLRDQRYRDPGHRQLDHHGHPNQGQTPSLDIDDAETRHLYGERRRWSRRDSTEEASYASA